MHLGDISVGDDSGNDDSVITAPSMVPSNTSSLLSLAASAASVLTPKGVPVTVGLSPQTISLISIGLFGIGGLFLLNMMRKR